MTKRTRGGTMGLYFRGMPQDEINALRARLNDRAGELGYTALTGPTAGEGNLAALLVAIDAGEVELVKVEGAGND